MHCVYRGSCLVLVGDGEEVPPPQPTRGCGEHRKLPQRVRGGAPAKNEFGALWSCQKATGGNHFEYSVLIFLFTLSSVIGN